MHIAAPAAVSFQILTWLTIGIAIGSGVIGVASAFGFRALRRTRHEETQATVPKVLDFMITRASDRVHRRMPDDDSSSDPDRQNDRST
jgi:hypothetical protein